jgi:uncharacterized protein (DUF58 family)
MAGEQYARTRPDRLGHLRPTGLRSLRPTGRGLGVALCLLALYVAEVVTEQAGLLPFVVVVGLPLVVAPFWALARARRATPAQVRAMVSPPLVEVNGQCELIVQLANEGDARLPPLSLDTPDGRRGSGVDGRGKLAPEPGRLIRWTSLEGRARSSTTWSIPTGRRGVFPIGPLRLWVHDPFGLVAVPVARAEAVTVVVHPVRAAVGERLLSPSAGSGVTVSGTGGHDANDDDPGGEWNGLRPYVPGDRLHLLSWPVEARLGTLMVQQFQPDGHTLFRIVLDDRAGVHRRAAFETALATVHALVSEAAQSSMDTAVTTLSGGGAMVAPTSEGMVELLTFLAKVVPAPHASANYSVGAMASPLNGERATVVTTSTARSSLPILAGDLSIVVVE